MRTSEMHPIRVDFVPDDALGLPGRLGMTFAPGKQHIGETGPWRRDLEMDLERLRQVYATDLLVSLMEEREYPALRIPDLFPRAEEQGIRVIRFPIRDGGVPRDAHAFGGLVAQVVAALRAGQTVVVHCKGGLGRTGLLAAFCLVALGRLAEEAILLVRRARPGAIETRAQEEFVRAFALPDA